MTTAKKSGTMTWTTTTAKMRNSYRRKTTAKMNSAAANSDRRNYFSVSNKIYKKTRVYLILRKSNCVI